MSHVVNIQTQIRDLQALQAACARLHLAEPEYKTVDLFSGQATGHAVALSGWRYPVVCDLASGKLDFDNYRGRWGHQKQLDELLQAYAIEKAKLAARLKGHTVTEKPLADGSVKLTINLGGVS